jgi:hypothetical protein
MILGDLQIYSGIPPLKLLKALAVISEHLHPEFDRNVRLVHGISKRSCVLASLAVRDFLEAIGIEAHVRPVATAIRALEGDTPLHSLGIGKPLDPRPAPPGLWSGHMVVIAQDWLIDTTLYQCVDRPAWRGNLSPMIAVKVDPEAPVTIPPELGERQGLQNLAATFLMHEDEDNPGYNYIFGQVWYDVPDNTGWRTGPDATHRNRRIKVVRRLVRRFGEWKHPPLPPQSRPAG